MKLNEVLRTLLLFPVRFIVFFIVVLDDASATPDRFFIIRLISPYGTSVLPHLPLAIERSQLLQL